MTLLFFLSYIIQNFTRLHYSARVTARVRASMLARNYALIYLLCFSTARGFDTSVNSWSNVLAYVRLSGDHFREFTKVALPKAKTFKYTPIGINYPYTAYYSSLSSIDRLLDGKNVKSQFLPTTTHYYENPYFTQTTVTVTFISNKSFSYQFYKFLRLILRVWFCWPKKYKISTNFTWLSGPWYQFRFLNKYYFKVYTI